MLRPLMTTLHTIASTTQDGFDKATRSKALSYLLVLKSPNFLGHIMHMLEVWDIIGDLSKELQSSTASATNAHQLFVKTYARLQEVGSDPGKSDILKPILEQIECVSVGKTSAGSSLTCRTALFRGWHNVNAMNKDRIIIRLKSEIGASELDALLLDPSPDTDVNTLSPAQQNLRQWQADSAASVAARLAEKQLRMRQTLDSCWTRKTISRKLKDKKKRKPAGSRRTTPARGSCIPDDSEDEDFEDLSEGEQDDDARKTLDPRVLQNDIDDLRIYREFIDVDFDFMMPGISSQLGQLLIVAIQNRFEESPALAALRYFDIPNIQNYLLNTDPAVLAARALVYARLNPSLDRTSTEFELEALASKFSTMTPTQEEEFKLVKDEKPEYLFAFILKHKDHFKPSAQVIRLFQWINCLPIATADVERGFSMLFYMRNERRSRTLVKNWDNIMMINLNGGSSLHSIGSDVLARQWEQRGHKLVDADFNVRGPSVKNAERYAVEDALKAIYDKESAVKQKIRDYGHRPPFVDRPPVRVVVVPPNDDEEDDIIVDDD